MYDAETWTLQKVNKYLESFEVLCWRGIQKIGWNDCVINEEVLQRVKMERNILQTIKRKKAKWICHIWHRNCLLKHLI